MLVQLAEFAELRGDYLAAVAALEEAGAQASELRAWGDLSHIVGKLAAIRLRMGDLEGARADLERAEQGAAQLGVGLSDAVVWLGLVRSELHFREGDTATATHHGEKVMTWLAAKQSGWWDGLRALVQARLALTVLAAGDQARCRRLLAQALRIAGDWVERPVLAAVMESIAVYVQHPAQPGPPARAAELAATLLGAAHTMRGCFDKGSLDAPAARASARAALGEAKFDAAYERGRALDRDDALSLAAGAVAIPVEAG